jgi:spoIIIJ-associated protein
VSDWDWVEAVGPTVDKAVQAAVADLGLESADAAEIEIIQEGKGGFLGIGGTDAIVRVRPKPKKSGRRRRRGGRGRGRAGENGDSERNGDRKPKGGRSDDNQQRSGAKKQGSGDKPQRSGDRNQRSGGGQRRESGQRNDRKDRQQRAPLQQRPEDRQELRMKAKEDEMEVEVDRAAQAEMVKDFLTGLLDAFGLEGNVDCMLEEDTIIANVTGEQTEALVGHKGAILQATHELCRTIVQRKSQAGARLRLDIGGYQERRREALRIYTGRLVEKVTEEGGEIMLEPMNPAERKVVHDAAAELGGVRTFSEGEEPHRSVVIAKEDTD